MTPSPPPEGEIREAHPTLGERPGEGEIGFVRCEHGHSGQTFVVDEEVDADIPKGQFNPYCVGCIMLWVVQKAKLKPMKFYIAKKPPQGGPQIVVPQQGLILPENVARERQQQRRKQRR